MTRALPIALTCALALTALPFTAAAQPLPSDPALVTGELDNGMHYIVRKHAYPPGRAVMWIHINTGSLNETDRQRGIAHYTEHMAFNGSENFAPGSLVPFFQSLGMQFGRDQNAFTNMQETCYQLSLPDANPETMGKGMTFFADVVSRLSLIPKEIDDERQIIQEERRRSLSGRQRVSLYVLRHETPGSIYGERDTIGTEETINAVNPADFHDFYSKWYCASNATLMVVADADPAEVIKIIKDKFSAAPKKPRPSPQPLNIKPYDKSFGIVATDPEVRSEDITIMRLEAARPPISTVPLYRANLVVMLGESALNRRFDDKIAAGNTSYQSGRVTARNEIGTMYVAELSGRAARGKWQPALNELALELQRARAFGFTAHELDDVKKQMIASAERAVETESTAPAANFMRQLDNSVISGVLPMSPEQRLKLLKDTLPTITPEEVGKRFADEFDPKTVAFIATMPSGDNVPTEAQLVEIGTKAFSVQPTQESESAHATTLMATLPTPGTVEKLEEHAPSKVWSGWLSNNARVHYRFMDLRKDEVTVNITLIGGQMLETAPTRGLTQAAQLAWSRHATKSLSSADVRSIMTGKKISVRGGGGGGGGGGRGGRGGGGGGAGLSDAIELTVSGSPEELETGMQLAYLLLTEPKIEPSSFTQFQTQAKERLEESLKNPQQLGTRLAASLPYPDSELRTKPLGIEDIDKLKVDAAQAWLDKLIAESPIEVTIVGDIEKQKAMDLVARYIGSLKSRPRVDPALYAAQRKIARPTGPRTVEKEVETQTNQAFVYSGFYGSDESDLTDTRALNMAARIISTRMIKEVREDAQLVYSIGAGARAATTYPGFGTFSAAAPTDPVKVPALVEKLASMYAQFAKEGPTSEEVDVAKKQMANTFQEQMKEPATWAARLQQMTFRHTNLDDFLAGPQAYQEISGKQIQDTFAKYYDGGKHSLVVVVKPKPAAATEKKADAGS